MARADLRTSPTKVKILDWKKWRLANIHSHEEYLGLTFWWSEMKWRFEIQTPKLRTFTFTLYKKFPFYAFLLNFTLNFLEKLLLYSLVIKILFKYFLRCNLSEISKDSSVKWTIKLNLAQIYAFNSNYYKNLNFKLKRCFRSPVPLVHKKRYKTPFLSIPYKS